MASFPRYAIYYAPAPGSDLDRFGASLLGYDAYNGVDLRFRPARRNYRIARSHRRSAKIRLSRHAESADVAGARQTEAELLAACAAFAETPRPVPRIKPIVDSISGFIAVVPAEPSAELERLAADCTREFDSFRAALTPGRPRAAKSFRPDAATARASRSLGISLCDGGLPLPPDADRPLDAARREPVLAMLRINSRLSASKRSRSTASLYSARKMRRCDSGFLGHWESRRPLQAGAD